jgi:hypothetical protein
MAKEDMTMEYTGNYIFYSKDEFNGFVEDTSSLIYKLMQDKHYVHD